MKRNSGIEYHIRTITRDIGDPIDARSGLANINVAEDRIKELEKHGTDVSVVKPHVEALKSYFEEILLSLGKEVGELVRRQEFGGEILSDEDGLKIERATAFVRTKITTKAALTHGKFIQRWFEQG